MLRCCKTLSICVGGYDVPYAVQRIESLKKILSKKYVVTIKKNCPAFFFAHLFEHDGVYKIWDCNDSCFPYKNGLRKPANDPRCPIILKCQMRPDSPKKYRPFFYFAKGSRHFDNQLGRLRKIPKTREKLYWRGREFCRHGTEHRGDRRNTLSEIRDVLNDDSRERKPKGVFYRELAQSKMVLSLPGLGKACHREFEAFAVGTPVLMPEYTNVYHVDLIPDHHYVSVSPHEGETMPEAIKRRYWETRDDDELLRFVSENAMEYYNNYCKFDSSVKWLIKLLEL